jgi:arabinofuranosyltransferase
MEMNMADAAAFNTARFKSWALPGLLLLALTVVLLFSAWLCDDAYITFRTVENLISGSGPRWNVLDRVQSFTHPLWMFLIAGVRAVTGEVYYSSIITSLILSLAAVLVLLRLSLERLRVAPLLLVVLLFSRAFIDYSTSGLENPLAHLLVVLFFGLWLRIEQKATDAELLKLGLLASAILLCRLDLLLLIAPALGLAAYGRRDRRGLVMALTGFAPFIAWELFSLVYYGVLVPNTAYAKLSAGVPMSRYVTQGAVYLRECARFDPVAATAILAGLLSGFLSRKPRQLAIAIGVALYLLYIVRIGGDFMAGRFITVPLLAALVLLGSRTGDSRRVVGAAMAVAIVLGFLAGQPTVLTGPKFGQGGVGEVPDSGVADERAFYYPTTGMLRADNRENLIQHPWSFNGVKALRRGQKTSLAPAVGFYGYFAGPDLHIIDKLALNDPLLARLPVDPQQPWRIGHFYRKIPAGYEASVLRPVSGIQDASIAELDNRLRLVTRGPLFSAERWRAIVALHFD